MFMFMISLSQILLGIYYVHLGKHSEANTYLLLGLLLYTQYRFDDLEKESK